MAQQLSTPDWPRYVVRSHPAPTWAALAAAPRPWLWVSGACSETLEEDVRSITQRFDHQWVWRGTPLEYGAPGYRQGPLLVPLDRRLFDHALVHWLPQNAGLILRGPEDGAVLVRHLQTLHRLVAADGLPVGFSLHAVRPLEELCEALSDDRRAALLGPIQSLLWYANHADPAGWLTVANPVASGIAASESPALFLSPDEEAALDRASFAWFMRDCVREFSQEFPDYVHTDNLPLLREHLNIFFGESKRLGMELERDVRHYMELRLRYPQSSFVHDQLVFDTLRQRQVAPMQRLFAVEERLRQLPPTAP